MDEHGRITESIELLELVRTAQAADELLDVHQIARKRGTSDRTIQEHITRLEDAGLLLGGLEEEEPPMVLPAGQQYLARRGEVSSSALLSLG
jgi:DNA-binding transcriptional ArsR family regulator